MKKVEKFLQAKRNALMSAPFLWRCVLALIAGALLSFIQAPYHLWFLIFPCFGLFYFFYAAANNKKQVFLTAFIFGLGYFVCGLNWIGNALLVEGNEYKWVWPFAVVALPALLASFTALYATIASVLFPQKNKLSGLFGFTLLIGLSEWVRGYAFTGFPWNLYGYTWIDVLPMAQSVSLLGPYALTLVTIFWGALAGFLALKKVPRIVGTAIGIISLIVVYEFGIFRLADAKVTTHEDFEIHIIQPNIAQEEKWKPENLAINFEKHFALSQFEKKHSRNLLVWPETSIPPALVNNFTVQERMKNLLSRNSILLAGALEVTRNPALNKSRYHNSVMRWNGLRAPLRMYSKSHLVPFGEYIPFQQFIPLKPVVAFSGFERGQGSQTTQVGNYPTFSPAICYEIIFPHQVVNKAMQRPDFILTVTNDAWYGDSAGPRQHFAQARFRAIEQGMSVVRSANTGISGVIDPYGRVVQKLNLMNEGRISTFLPKNTDKTFYSRYGDYPLMILMLLGILGFIHLQRRS